MHERSDDLYLAASMYYVQGETMESIARQLSVSRSTISRLLKDARDSGLVRITLADPIGVHSNLATTIQRIFGVRTVIVPVREGSAEVHRLDRVARAAAQLISESVHDHSVIGIAWGTTLAAVAPHLRPRDVNDTTVVQINGGANRVTSGIPYVGAIISQVADAFSSDVVHFPVPAFFAFAETKQLMWRERTIRSVLTVQRTIDLAVFGVGALDGPVPSHVYSAGYLDTDDLAQIRRERVVGDVCTVLLRENGSYADISLNARASGLTPAELQRIPRRICIVAGTSKAPALVGALRARVATDLVVDEATARAVLDRL